MSETVVDARGHLCPKPLIMTKKALTDLTPGQELTILLDNETSRDNVHRFLLDNGAEATCTETDGVFAIRVDKFSGKMPKAQVEDHCGVPLVKSHAIAINNDKMGVGPDELGQILIEAFVNTILEASPLPGAIVMYNNGIHLAVEGSPLIDSLQELESCGVKILVCGTCLDYFGKKELLKAGTVSNMYEILEILRAASHVIVP